MYHIQCLIMIADPMDIFQNTMRNYLFGEQTETKGMGCIA